MRSVKRLDGLVLGAWLKVHLWLRGGHSAPWAGGKSDAGIVRLPDSLVREGEPEQEGWSTDVTYL